MGSASAVIRNNQFRLRPDSFDDLGDFRERFTIGVVRTGCDASREERRVAGHTSDEQRCSAPVCAAKRVNLPRKSP